jgi:aerobic-type carbon monoxide dehydrogenase small subunit (CoxS/CutS family)
MAISINGLQTDLPADARVSLSDQLREHLHLSGTPYQPVPVTILARPI